MPTSQLQDDINKVESSVGETKITGTGGGGGGGGGGDCRHLSLEVSKVPPRTSPRYGSLRCDRTALKLLVGLCQEFTRC